MRIMRHLWTRKMSARELTSALNDEAGEAPMAHSTVQTLLRQLENKGAVGHQSHDRTFVFEPLVEKSRTLSHATREFIDRLFSGSVQGLMAHLLSSEQVSAKELDKIEKLIAQRRKEAK